MSQKRRQKLERRAKRKARRAAGKAAYAQRKLQAADVGAPGDASVASETPPVDAEESSE